MSVFVTVKKCASNLHREFDSVMLNDIAYPWRVFFGSCVHLLAIIIHLKSRCTFFQMFFEYHHFLQSCLTFACIKYEKMWVKTGMVSYFLYPSIFWFPIYLNEWTSHIFFSVVMHPTMLFQPTCMHHFCPNVHWIQYMQLYNIALALCSIQM